MNEFPLLSTRSQAKVELIFHRFEKALERFKFAGRSTYPTVCWFGLLVLSLFLQHPWLLGCRFIQICQPLLKLKVSSHDPSCFSSLKCITTHSLTIECSIHAHCLAVNNLSVIPDDVLRQLKDFVLGFNNKLGDIREVLSETLSEAWNSENDILSIATEPIDTVDIASLIKTENAPFDKVHN